MSRRLLLVGGGGASFTAPPTPVPFTITTEGGAWTGVATPHAFHHNERTYLLWVGGASKPNDIEIIAFDHGAAAETYDGPVLLHDNLGGGSTTTPDSHLGPSGVALDDSRLLTVYAGHQADTMRAKRSNDPDDIVAGFTAPITVDPVSGVYTYPVLFRMGSRVYCFARNDSESWMMTHTDDNGDTWAAGTRIWTSAANIVYATIGGNGTNRIDFAFSDDDPQTAGGGWWNLWMDDAGAFFDATGASIGSPPFGPGDGTEIIAAGSDIFLNSLVYAPDGRVVIGARTTQTNPVEIMEYRQASVGSATFDRHDIDTSETLPGGGTGTGDVTHAWGDPSRFLYGWVNGGNLYAKLATTGDDGVSWGTTVIEQVSCPPAPVYVHGSGPIAFLYFKSGMNGSDDFDAVEIRALA